jgi:quercetin dioxygenase-like cupin family protein
MTPRTLVPRLVAAHDGPTYRVAGDLVTFKATGEDTGDAYALFESRTPPGMGMPPHRQRYEDEAFYVLEGTYTMLIGDRQQRLQPDDYAFVPRGTVHGFTNIGSSPARMLIMVSPGGIHEQFFAEAGELIPDPSISLTPAAVPDMQQLVEIAAKYAIEILSLPQNSGPPQ